MLNIKDVKVGDKLIVLDNAFTCLLHNQIVEVHEDKKRQLYIVCDLETHYLDGQLDDKSNLVGLDKAP